MGDSPHPEDTPGLKKRLAALEQRLAALESWVSMPLKPPPSMPVLPVHAAPPPIKLKLAEPPPIPSPAHVPPLLPVVPRPVIPFTLSKQKKSSTPDLEAMIGQNWASWIGGIILLLGISFFLKYAWDQGWIRPSPQARVIASVLLGVLVCAAGEWVWRKHMRGLAATLHGTGVAIAIAGFFGANLYFDPPVMSRGAAFTGVAIAAAFGIVLALRVNVMTVAVLSLIGAYISPGVLSSGEDKSVELLAYLFVLAAAQWMLSFLKGTRVGEDGRWFHWLSLRWVALIGSFVWFFVWWGGFGERNNHHLLAEGWLALIYFGFLAEVFFTLQIVIGRMPSADEARPDSVSQLLHKPIGPPGADVALAIFSLVSTAVTFGAAYLVLQHEPRSTIAIVAIALAAIQGMVAIYTVSRAMMWSALLQSAALVTLAIPLWFEGFSITIAWLALAVAIATMGWQFNLKSARGWAVGLLFLSLIRLATIDSFSPGLRTVVGTILDQEVTQWLLMAWCTAGLFHLVAWMQPHRGNWPGVEHWFADARGAKRWSDHGQPVAIKPVLDYAPPPQLTTKPPAGIFPEFDPAGITLAAFGTLVFIAASASLWSRTPLTLLSILWLTPIISLISPGRRLGYGPHAALLIAVIVLYWNYADNLDPLLNAWNRPQRDTTPPVLNLAALAGLLICGVIFLIMRKIAARDFGIKQAATVVGVILFAALTYESWRTVDYAANHGPASADVGMVKQMSMSVLWSLIGFIAVGMGFWKKIKPLRIVALVLLGVTIAKVFIVDMKDVEAVWRILSFIALGSLLLGVSYLYHKQVTRQHAADSLSE